MTELPRPAWSRRHLGKLLLAAPLVGAATRAWSQQVANRIAVPIETRTLDELHKAALAEGGELLVYGGGDLPNGSAGTERAFNARFPGMKIRILVDRSKYHHVRIDNQLALGKLACDAAHILSLNAYDRWKADGRLLAYKPAGWDQIYPDLTDPDAAYTAFTVFAFSTVFNTAQVNDADAPRDATDFLDPKFKDRIALTYPHDDDAVLYQFDRIVSEYGWGYLDRLLAQNVDVVSWLGARSRRGRERRKGGFVHGVRAARHRAKTPRPSSCFRRTTASCPGRSLTRSSRTPDIRRRPSSI